MLVKQISVFLENKSGRLAEVTKVLGSHEIDIGALSIADTTDFGVLRLIVNKPEEAESILKEKDFLVSSASVVAVSIDDKPGGLAVALSALESERMSIEYMYAFVGKAANEAIVILKVEDPQKAVEVLKRHDIKVLPSKVVYNL